MVGKRKRGTWGIFVQKITMNASFFHPLNVYRRKIEFKLRASINLSPKKPNLKKALMSYVVHPFIISKDELNRAPHTNPFECLEMSDALLEAGYEVDVINWTDTKFIPKKSYDLIIDVHQNIGRLKDVLPKTCVKIFYITGAHWSFQNGAENKRLAELKERRGVTLMPRRNIVPADNIEYADFAIALGSDFAKNTYAYAKKEIEQVPLPSTVFFDSPEHKDFDACRKNFVWIGGGGAVHKGLDVVLECFRDLPDFKLIICGPVEVEKDFATLYKKELSETPWIKTVGRIDISGQLFKNIVGNSLALIYPSCSEGQSGSVITALQTGLIPLVNYESGVNINGFGKILTDHSPEYLKKEVVALSEKPAAELRKNALDAWKYARTHHTRAIFRQTFENILKKRNLL
jgi:hypothetical protein